MTDTWNEIKLLVGTAIQTDPKRCVGALLEPLGALATPLYGLLLGALANAILAGDNAGLVLCAVGLLAVTALQYLASWVGTSTRSRLAEEVGFRFDQEIMNLTNRLPTITHLEQPEYADKLELLRQGQGVLGQSLTYLATTTAAVVSSLGTAVVLFLVEPVVLVLVLFVLPAFATVSVQRRWETRAENESAEPARLARHLRGLTTRHQSGMELRACGLQDEILDRAWGAWSRARRPTEHAFLKSSLLASGRAVLFGVGFTLVVGYVLWQAGRGNATPGDVVTAAVVCQQVERQVVGPAYSIAGLGRVLRNAGRVLWLRSYAQRLLDATRSRQPAPARLRKGILLDRVSFRYPQSDEWALRGIDVELPAGGTVAVLGENGAGKSTLIKLLCGLYEPTDGRVVVDGTDLGSIDLVEWRARLSAVFQDYTRPELTAGHAIGIGDIAHDDEPTAVRNAVRRADANALIDGMPRGLDQQLGSVWTDGIDLSGGQWQRVALARGLMRTNPLMLFFDEPASNLDAPTEHAFFERYLQQARETAKAYGTITLLVTHRFSTVRSADLILVLDDGKLVECGAHADLLKNEGGLYRELYTLQARAYA
jgi:ATP-binding cassette, subfamily B, bacterial